METGFLFAVSDRVICLVFLALMLGAIEAGFRLGRRRRAKLPEVEKSQVATVAAAVLGVLGLLLGFTMSMDVSRFEARKQLVLDEANAVGTSYLRTRLLPAPQSAVMANLFCEYVAARLEYGDAPVDLARIEAARNRALRLQNELWTRATAYGRENPNPVEAGLLLQSLNQVIDLESARWMAFQNHVPATVIYLNGIIALLAGNLIGYSFGLERQRQLFCTSLLALAITVVLAVIIDIDRPRRGFIRVSQQPMVDLQKQLAGPGQSPTVK